MTVGKPRHGKNGKLHAGSWGMLVVGRSSARFLWYSDPRELLCAVLDQVSPTGNSKPVRWRSFTGDHGVADEDERLRSFLMVEGLIKAINRRSRDYGFRVSWWGPLADLQDSMAPVPAMIRAWFRRSRRASQEMEESVDGSIAGEHLPAFADFLERVSFGADELGEA